MFLVPQIQPGSYIGRAHWGISIWSEDAVRNRKLLFEFALPQALIGNSSSAYL
jgi:hypothetical protein